MANTAPHRDQTLEIELPAIPSPFLTSNEAATTPQKIKIHQKTVKQLLAICREYGLRAPSTRKCDLIVEILKFSASKDTWGLKAHTINCRRVHKGNREMGSKTKKLSSVRAKILQSQAEVDDSTSTTHYANGDLVAWADSFVARQKMLTNTATSAPASARAGLSADKLVSELETMTNLSKIIQSLNAIVHEHQAFNTSSESAFGPTAGTQELSRTLLTSTDVPMQTLTTPTNMTILPIQARPDISQKQKECQILLADGVFKYTNSADNYVDPPLSEQVLSNLSELSSMWDDTSPRWRNSSLVTVCNKPIALRYLHQYYRNFRYGRKIWDGLKHNWRIWKMLAEEYSLFEDDDAFWDKWSPKRDKLPMTIYAVLSQQKQHDDEKTAQIAREEYFGKQFERHFSYTKSGTLTVITKSSAIAKRYKQLKSC